MRLYLDTNIFSSGRNGKLTELFSLFDTNKSMFNFFYSHAHILDLSNDDTDEKYEDLSFISNYVDNQYLAPVKDIDNIVVNIKNPRTSFEEFLKSSKNPSVEDPYINDELAYMNKKYEAYPQKTMSEISSLKQSEKIDEFEEKILIIRSSNASFEERVVAHGYLEQLDEKNFRKLRGFNKRFFTLKMDKPEDIETIDYTINSLIQQNPQKLLDVYPIRFILYFFYLNYLGVDGESNNKKKAKVFNAQIDGWHTLYAGFCDVFISNDIGCREKAKRTYEKFDIGTVVVSPQEFIQSCRILIPSIYLGPKNLQVIEKYEQDSFVITEVKLDHFFLGVFDYCTLFKTKSGRLHKAIYYSSTFRTIEQFPISEISIVLRWINPKRLKELDPQVLNQMHKNDPTSIIYHDEHNKLQFLPIPPFLILEIVAISLQQLQEGGDQGKENHQTPKQDGIRINGIVEDTSVCLRRGTPTSLPK